MLFHLAVAKAGAGAGTDLATVVVNLLTKFAKAIGLGIVLMVAVISAGHIAGNRFGKAIAVVLIATIPAWLILDPTGALNTLKSTIG